MTVLDYDPDEWDAYNRRRIAHNAATIPTDDHPPTSDREWDRIERGEREHDERACQPRPSDDQPDRRAAWAHHWHLNPEGDPQ